MREVGEAQDQGDTLGTRRDAEAGARHLPGTRGMLQYPQHCGDPSGVCALGTPPLQLSEQGAHSPAGGVRAMSLRPQCPQEATAPFPWLARQDADPPAASPCLPGRQPCPRPCPRRPPASPRDGQGEHRAPTAPSPSPRAPAGLAAGTALPLQLCPPTPGPRGGCRPPPSPAAVRHALQDRGRAPLVPLHPAGLPGTVPAPNIPPKAPLVPAECVSPPPPRHVPSIT